QCSTGPGSNPHDVTVVGPHKAYVTRFARPELWIVDPGAPSCAGFFLDSIDLGAFADADGLPEMDQMTLVADRLFVSLERLDRRRDFAPAGKSLLVAIDTATGAVVGTVELSGGNALGQSARRGHEPRTAQPRPASARHPHLRRAERPAAHQGRDRRRAPAVRDGVRAMRLALLIAFVGAVAGRAAADPFADTVVDYFIVPGGGAGQTALPG